jgi:hypothetical protein
MSEIIGEFRLGEDIAIALDAVTGPTAAVSGITAVMKPAAFSGNRLSLDPAAAGVALSVAPQAPASAGWTISLPHDRTAAMPEGLYGIDARLEIAGSVTITEQTAFIRLSRAALA